MPTGLNIMQGLFGGMALLAWVSPVTAQDAPVALPGGSVATLVGTDLRLALTDVTDTRCQSEVACVWEGTIRLVLAIDPGGPTAQTIVLCNACEDGGGVATAAGHQFDFVGLEPATKIIEALGRPARIGDYTGIVQITPLSGMAN